MSSETQGGQMLSTMTMDKDVAELPDMDASTMSAEHRLFKREVGFFVNLSSCCVLVIVFFHYLWLNDFSLDLVLLCV